MQLCKGRGPDLGNGAGSHSIIKESQIDDVGSPADIGAREEFAASFKILPILTVML
ncbi:MAG: hypothetical protein QG575_1040 [Euryarchaeota archaeon]|nr:hypothetical protein [Euryarchaeota archaeon]